MEDGFIRNAYFGGATDIYKAYGKDLHYYDVNSLYPHAMMKPMPHKISYFIKDMTDIKLEDFFGFCEAKITTPDKLVRPLLPFRTESRTIFPVGTWTGTYFSEELKAVVKYGYKVELISGYAFTKRNLFKNYVKYFYNVKKHSKGAERFIAKMHLNQLYGIFGRKIDLIETVNIHRNDLPWFLVNRVVSEVITVTDDIRTVLLKNNININSLDDLNYEFKLTLKSNQYEVKTNVAVIEAAAVTSYARIHMMQYKLDDNVLYTNTDSIFTDKLLPNHMVNNELGFMKDELDGKIIKEALFLDIKKYGYYYVNEDNNIVNRSVVSGVERDSLTFEDFKSIFKGISLTTNVSERLFKIFKYLQVKIITTRVTIKHEPFKLLIDNVYQPIKLHNGLIKGISFKDKLVKYKYIPICKDYLFKDQSAVRDLTFK